MKIGGEAGQVRIRVECAREEVWGDPDTHEQAEIKDCEDLAWSHLGICRYAFRKPLVQDPKSASARAAEENFDLQELPFGGMAHEVSCFLGNGS